jgi:hypothetical protein
MGMIMTGDKTANEVPFLTKIVGIVGTIGALSSLGNFVLNLMGGGGGNTDQLFWLQLLPFGAFLFAFLLAIVDYDIRRDKWPSRLKELARSIVAISVFGPEEARPEICRPVVEVIKVYHRMALAEGKIELAKDLKRDIDRWEKGAER